jgi:hypothetical protein
MSKEDYTNVYIFELSFFSKTLAKKVAKEIFEKTGQKGILYEYEKKLPKKKVPKMKAVGY